MTEADHPHAPQPDEVNVFTYLQVLARWKRFLLINVLSCAVLVGAATLLIPNRYRATASVVPPKQESPFGSTLSQLTKDFLPQSMLGKIGAGRTAYNYLAILESRTAMEAVARRFDLAKVYDISGGSIQRTVNVLRSRCTFEIEDNGNVSIAVEDEDPARAAALANAFVDVLNEISVRLGTEEARNNREYVERRYAQALEDMKAAEDSLARFQARYGLYALPEQVKGAIEAAAQIKAQASMAEIELGILERSLGKDNPQTALKRAEIAELNRKLREMRFGVGVPAEDRSLSPFVPFRDLPELGTQYLRLYRNFEIQTKVIQLTVPIYEQAKIDEQKQTPVVLVLDRAVPPERKYAPKRSLIVLLAVVVVFFLSALLVFLMESLTARGVLATPIERSLASAVGRIRRVYRMRA
ncbi:MAG: GNVR domain-containing protein [Bacteroidota bacterium]|nr:GNVR domain-containing protein [Bacteroidota bacterium]